MDWLGIFMRNMDILKPRQKWQKICLTASSSKYLNMKNICSKLQTHSIFEAFFGYSMQYHQAEDAPDTFNPKLWTKFEEILFEKTKNRDYSSKI